MTATATTFKGVYRPTVKEMSDFLSDYSVMLFGSGATCIRMERNVRRIAETMGMEAEFSIWPRHIHLTVRDGDENLTTVVAIKDIPISFAKISLLSRMSWQMADGHLGFRAARRTLQVIGRTAGTGPWQLLLLVPLANASFCRLFGGDITAMIIVFCSTFAGYLMKQLLAEKKTDVRIIFIICAFISSVIASTGFLFSLGTTPYIAVATSVLYLVPGIPFINSFCDMLDRHYLCSLGRMMNAIVLSACLSIGLFVGMEVMGVSMF